MPEPTLEVVVERIANLKEFFKEEFSTNADAHKQIMEHISKNDNRIKVLEDWKLVFVAKYSVYSGIALFLGAALANIAMKMLFK